MKSTQVLILLLSMFYGLNSVAQYQLWVQFPASTEVKINAKTLKKVTNAIVINSVKPDSVRVESLTNGKWVGKVFVLRKEMNQYALIKNTHDEFKYRLRSNLNFGETQQIELSTFPPFSSKPLAKAETVSLDSIIDVLEKTKFEFEKVEIISNYIPEKELNTEATAKLCGYLKHDFSKWRIIKSFIETHKEVTDFNAFLAILETETYKNLLIEKLQDEN